MKRILFVDDEPSVLDGLRRMLRSQRREWEMTFATSGHEALELAASDSFDVIVTDMKMPRMDGAELLVRMQDAHPETVRFVLSGHAELESVMRTVPVAHQFLTKPCDADELRETVTRACELRCLLHNELAEKVIGSLEGLPSRPETYSAILEAIANPDVEIASVVSILETDVAMSVKLLQLVNSAFFGLPTDISDIDRAVNYLGLNQLRDLVLSIEVFRPPTDAGAETEKFISDLQARSLLIGRIASQMSEDKRASNLAFTAGMLHDIGLLVMVTQMTDVLRDVLRRSKSLGKPIQLIEEETLGVSHAEIGAYLLGVWGLPYPLLEAAAYHHHPSKLPQESFSALTAVHVASALVDSRRDFGIGDSGGQIDLEYISSLGLKERLADWEALADTELTTAEESSR